MHEEYAKSIGKTTQQLTLQEKIQAEVNGIMEETQFQVGDAAKYADTYAGRLATLGKILRDIKVNLGNAFMPIANIVIPLLSSLASAISRVTATLAQFSQALFGKAPKAQAKATQAQAGAMADLGDETEAAGKKAKKALAGFDEINKIGEKDAAGGVSAGGGGIATEDLMPIVDDGTGGLMGEISTKAQEMAEKVRTAFTNMKNAIIENKNIIIPAIGGIVGALAGFAIFSTIKSAGATLKNLGDIAKAVWGILAANPIALVAVAIGALIGALVAAYASNEDFRNTVNRLWAQIKTALTPVIQGLGNVLIWLWQNVIVPLGKIILDVLVVAFETLVSIATWLWQYVLRPLGSFIIGSLVPVFLEIARVVGTVFKFAVEGLIKVLEFLWYSVMKPIVTWLGATFKPAFEIVGEGIRTVIRGWQTTFDGLIKFITGVFTANWRQAWEGVRQIFKGIFDSLYGIVKVPLNLIISAINTVIRGLNRIKFSIPSWVPGVGGKSFGINIPTIPRLAKGGITDGPMLAMIGDNPGGREVVSPLDDLMGMISSAVSSAVGDNGGDMTVIVKIGDDTITEKVISNINRKSRISGATVITV